MGIPLAAVTHECGTTFGPANGPSWTIVPGPGHGTIIYVCPGCQKLLGVAPAPPG